MLNIANMCTSNDPPHPEVTKHCPHHKIYIKKVHIMLLIFLIKTLNTASREKRSLLAPFEIITSEKSAKSTWDL